MKIVIVAWVNSGGVAQFESKVPLLFSGRRNRDLGFSNAIDIVFLKGLGRLDPSYRSRLEECGYELQDAEFIFKAIAQTFPALDRFGVYEKFCFLRWLVLAEIYPGEPLLHADGDVVFNEDPATIASLFAENTLVLQGCPALTAISHRDWFEIYAVELARFSEDIEGYSKAAWAERVGWEQSYHCRWAGSRDRPIISSDQDLLSHLIHTERIRQANPATLQGAISKYAFFENPLLIGDLVPNHPLTYHRSGGIDYLGAQQVAVWHMQNDWCNYLAKQLIRFSLGPLKSRDRLAVLVPSREGIVLAALRRISGRRIFSRENLYHRFFSKSDFGSIFTEGSWWEEGVFVSEEK